MALAWGLEAALDRQFYGVVPEHERQTTIFGRLDDDYCGCKSPKFAIQYEPGKINLTQDEFDSAVAEFNDAVKKPIWWYPLWPLIVSFHAFTCHVCDPYQRGGCVDFVLEKMAEKMSEKFAYKGVKFIIRVRLEASMGWGALPCCGECYAEKDGYFLVIQQQPYSVTNTTQPDSVTHATVWA